MLFFFVTSIRAENIDFCFSSSENECPSSSTTKSFTSVEEYLAALYARTEDSTSLIYNNITAGDWIEIDLSLLKSSSVSFKGSELSGMTLIQSGEQRELSLKLDTIAVDPTSSIYNITGELQLKHVLFFNFFKISASSLSSDLYSSFQLVLLSSIDSATIYAESESDFPSYSNSFTFPTIESSFILYANNVTVSNVEGHDSIIITFNDFTFIIALWAGSYSKSISVQKTLNIQLSDEKYSENPFAFHVDSDGKEFTLAPIKAHSPYNIDLKYQNLDQIISLNEMKESASLPQLINLSLGIDQLKSGETTQEYIIIQGDSISKEIKNILNLLTTEISIDSKTYKCELKYIENDDQSISSIKLVLSYVEPTPTTTSSSESTTSSSVSTTSSSVSTTTPITPVITTTNTPITDTTTPTTDTTSTITTTTSPETTTDTTSSNKSFTKTTGFIILIVSVVMLVLAVIIIIIVLVVKKKTSYQPLSNTPNETLL